ncbi:MAG: ABC transporter permease [Euryarchaeota archaeon]|nr:ABC transporter permease [Euryarchaeota archaeon]
MVGRALGIFWGQSRTVAGVLVWMGLVVVVAFVVVAVLAPWIAPYEPNFSVQSGATPPSSQHVFGTNPIGQDMFSRVVWGARVPLAVVAISSILSLAIGAPLGLVSGYYGGLLDRFLVLVMDSIYAFPGLLLAVVVAAVLGQGIVNVSLVIALVYIPTYFRVIRNHVASVKEELFVEASDALALPRMMVLTRYVLPPVAQSIPVIFSVSAADAILTQAGLSFLGLGLPVDIPDWGLDVSRAVQRGFQTNWWSAVFPGLAIISLTTALAFISEGLNDILNPLLRRRDTR